MLIEILLEAFSGPQETDTLGVPLLDSDRIWSVQESQQKHTMCLQDPDGVQLYTKTGNEEDISGSEYDEDDEDYVDEC